MTISYSVNDNCDPPTAIICTLIVSSNEPVNGTGDGDTAPNWEIVDSHQVRLRAERGENGGGRIYKITISCTDTDNNSSTRAVTAVVPHNLN